MFWIITFAVIGALWGLSFGYDPLFDTFFDGAMGALVGTIVALIVGAFIYNGYTFNIEHKANLVSLADGAGIHGQFFLGSGIVDSVPSFTWYEQDGTNSYVRKDADAEATTVHYLLNNKTKPYYTFKKEKPNDKGWLKKWGLNLESGYKVHYDFYIPRGSITQQYILDNK